MFSGEEAYGKYVDLYTNHTAYNNLKGIGKRPGYLQYLDILMLASKGPVHEELSKETRLTKDYESCVLNDIDSQWDMMLTLDKDISRIYMRTYYRLAGERSHSLISTHNNGKQRPSSKPSGKLVISLGGRRQNRKPKQAMGKLEEFGVQLVSILPGEVGESQLRNYPRPKELLKTNRLRRSPYLEKAHQSDCQAGGVGRATNKS